MRWKLILIFLLLATAATAQQDHHYFGTLDIESVTFGTINIEQQGENPEIRDLAINISFYAKKAPGQKIISSQIETDPITDQTYIEPEHIKLFWAQARPGNYNYSIKSTIKKEDYFVRISQKIEYPPKEFNESISTYQQPTEFIDINRNIREKATELAEGETDYYRIVFKIADWVENNIKYDLSTVTSEAVQKSSWVIENKIGVCDELTNLYISMLRSLGIPARFISGHTYTGTEEGFGNHGWSEVYFPDNGWVPVDVTFGQFGWIGPTHITFKTSLDSGEPSAEYTWKARNAKVEVKTLNSTSKIISAESTIKPYTTLKAEPLAQKAAPGSYVPLQVTVINNHDYYVPLTLYVTKAPGLEEDNRKPILLRPKEKRTVFWTMKIPEPENKASAYKAIIEVQTGFGANSTSSILYGYGYPDYSKDLAYEMIKDLETKEEKDYLPNLNVLCSTNKPMYYPSENATLECKIKNTGNTALQNIKSCANNECKPLSLTIGEEKKQTWHIALSHQTTSKIKVTFETENLQKTEYADIKIVNAPDLKIANIMPSTFDYKQKYNLSLQLSTKGKAQNLNVKIKNVAVVSMNSLEGTETAQVPFNPKKIRKGKLEISAIYKDEMGKQYSFFEEFRIEIQNIPWYMKLLNYILA